MTAAVESYRFPAARSGPWLGLPVSSLLVLAAAVIVAVSAMTAGVPVWAVLLLLAGAVLLAVVPVGGQPVTGWFPSVVDLAGHVIGGRRVGRASVEISTDRGPQARSLPGGLRVAAIREEGSLAVIGGPRGTRLVVFATAGESGFAVSDPGEQAARIAGWGRALDALAGEDSITELAWITRTVPADLHPADPDGPENHGSFRRYAASLAVHRQVWLTVTYRPGPGTGTELAARTARALTTAAIAVRPLAAQELRGILRACLTVTDANDAAVTAGSDRPCSWQLGWDTLRTDDAWHRSFTAVALPTAGMAPAWLEPVLLPGPPGTSRSVAVRYRPVPRAEAARASRTARTRASLDSGDRQRLGFVASAAADAAIEDAAALDGELHAGHRLYRLSLIITVTAPSRTALEEGCRQLTADAATARIDLRPTHGRHDRGLAATRPGAGTR